MNTKTMRLPPRRVLTPIKRKEREEPDTFKASKLAKPTATQQAGSDKALEPAPPQAGSDKAMEPASPNQLLAGYLAHEYLTKGTLFGQPWESARAEAVPVSRVESIKVSPSQRAEAEPSVEVEPYGHRRYVEVSRLLKIDGAHLPGIVNPTQLARFLQL